MNYLKNFCLNYFILFGQIKGPLKLDKNLFHKFLATGVDPLPNFEGPKHLKSGRGKDHPKYGRWVQAFAGYYKPDIIVEVGTYAGGTAVGWARALKTNKKGELICVDNDSYTSGIYPEITKKNILNVGLEDEKFTLKSDDSKIIIPSLAKELKGKVDIYLVDGDHNYKGALADIENGLPMLKPNGFLLVHDLDKNRKMLEATEEHPYPVYEAFTKIIDDTGFDWCILKFIRKHLGIIKVRPSSINPKNL